MDPTTRTTTRTTCSTLAAHARRRRGSYVALLALAAALSACGGGPGDPGTAPPPPADPAPAAQPPAPPAPPAQQPPATPPPTPTPPPPVPPAPLPPPIALPPPAVTAITPSSGPASGNTAVTLTGTGFVSGCTVTIGGTPAILGPVTATTITLTTPGGPAGLAAVTVTNPGGQSETIAGGFDYLAAPPVVAAINVHGSPQAGGGLLLFAGTGLDSTISVTFGGAPATNLVHNPVPGTLQVTIPPSPLGPAADGFVDLVLTNGDGQTTTVAGFHYGNPPSSTGFSPTTGPRGTVMVIDGADFTADAVGPKAGLQVSFGGTLATITQKSPTQITVTVPKLNPGVYEVIIANFDGQFTVAPGSFVAPGP